MTKKSARMTGFLVLAVVLIASIVLPTKIAAQDQVACGARGAIIERLANHFGETRRGIGLGTQNRVVEVFASDATGTWTITVTLPDGRMCLVASGQNWEDRMDDLSALQDIDA